MLKPRKQVALLIDTATGWGRNIIRGIDRYARESGDWDLTLQPYSQVDYISIPARWSGDGIIARVGGERMARELKESGLPVVNVSSIVTQSASFPSVITHYEKVGALAAEHLIGQGFSSFAFCAPSDTPYACKRIYDGYSSQLKQMGFAAEFVKLGRKYSDAGEQQERLQAWLRGKSFPLAVLAWSIEAPHLVVRACQANNILIPDELAVISSASISELILQVINPAVSCVVTPEQTIGYEAALLLDKLMAGQAVPEERRHVQTMPTHVEVRASSDVLHIEDPMLVKAIRFMRTHAGDGIQVGDVAQHAGLSRRALEQRMQRFVRRTPAEELRQIRLGIARELLAHSSLAMPDVAQRAGFGTVEHFIIFFKKAVGLTPLQYAKKHRSSV